jgi:hypothetical protein
MQRPSPRFEAVKFSCEMTLGTPLSRTTSGRNKKLRSDDGLLSFRNKEEA